MSKLTVGISLFARPDTNIWSNGINQNIAFLVMLLKRLPQVGKIYLLNGGDATDMPPALDFNSLDVTLVKPHDVTYELDVVIEMGATLPLEWLRHMSRLGATLIAFLAGHTYATVAESPVFDKPDSTIFHGAPIDEIWVLPQHVHTCTPMLKTVMRAPVIEMPHLWFPAFVEQQAVRVINAGWARPDFATRMRQRASDPAMPTGWNVAIFEPNISVVKSCFVPMLVCEHAYRQDPRSVACMRVMNTFHMKDHLTFNRFAANLDLTRDGRASYEPRLVFAEAVTGMSIDAVVAHQWECGLNYAYYDALDAGYPLIHNSEFLLAAGVGLYYPHFSARAGGDALLEAWRKPAVYWQDYARNAATFLKKLSPLARTNAQAFASRLAPKLQLKEELAQ